MSLKERDHKKIVEDAKASVVRTEDTFSGSFDNPTKLEIGYNLEDEVVTRDFGDGVEMFIHKYGDYYHRIIYRKDPKHWDYDIYDKTKVYLHKIVNFNGDFEPYVEMGYVPPFERVMKDIRE